MGPPVLLYDGTCGLCAASVRFVLGHERRRDLRFAPLDGAFARGVLARHTGLRDLDTVVWYDPPSAGRAERLLVRSAAVFEVLRYLGGAWRIGLVARAVPRPLLDAVYRLVARWRRRLFPPRAACAVAPASERERFLD